MKFLCPDVNDVCPDNLPLADGSRKILPIGRIQFAPVINGKVEELEIPFNRADLEQMRLILDEAKALIPTEQRALAEGEFLLTPTETTNAGAL